MQALILVAALACLLGAYGLSQAVTVPFIESANEKASISYVDFMWTLPYTSFLAIWVGLSYGRRVPIGAIAQGVLYFTAVGGALYAGSMPGR